MGIETVIEGMVVQDAEAAGWMCEKFQVIGKRGSLDRFFAKAGRVVFIEFKAPGKSKNTSTGQNRFRDRLQKAGVEHYVVSDPISAYDILGIEKYE